MNPEMIIGKKLEDIADDLEHSGIKDNNEGLEGEEPSYYLSALDSTWEILLGDGNFIKTIFLYLNKGYPSFLGITNNIKRDSILEMFGTPIAENGESTHRILGRYGAWEKYEKDNYYIHIEHEPDNGGVKMVTIMVKEPKNV